MIIKPTTDKTLPWVDYSTLSAVNTCPRWGLINNWHGKHLPSGVERVLPLEAGRAMHDVFACARIFDLLTEHGTTAKPDNSNSLEYYTRYKGINAYAERLFNTPSEPRRWEQAMRYFDTGEDAETRCMQMSLSLLETSGYHDDPRDTKRTQANLESAAISYIQRYPLGRFIPVCNKDCTMIGVEVPFDVTLHDKLDQPLIRFIGRVDAVCVDTLRPNMGAPEVHENKTGSRIDTVWSSSFDTSNQVTGYCVAMSCILGYPIRDVMMWGLQIPVPKASSYTDGIMRYPTTRNDENFYEWQEWVEHTLRQIDKYEADPTNAPMYTHSCSRYFRSCALIPLCTETRERRKHIFDNEMVVERWSPLDVDNLL
jgi:hypothetical protein